VLPNDAPEQRPAQPPQALPKAAARNQGAPQARAELQQPDLGEEVDARHLAMRFAQSLVTGVQCRCVRTMAIRAKRGAVRARERAEPIERLG
jgi:hypothetical protein